MRVSWLYLLLMPLLGSSASLHRRDEYQSEKNGPQRVRIRAFAIAISPALSQLSTDSANTIKDYAEALLQDNLEAYNFGINTQYDYSGLLGVENITQTADSTFIFILGGLIVFTYNSTLTPSIGEIEQIAADAWMPALTEVLQRTSTIQNVSEAIYVKLGADIDISLSPTFAPSHDRSTVPSTVPSDTPSERKNPSAIEEEIIPVLSTTNSASEHQLPIITGAGIAGIFAIVALAMLLLHRHRRKAYWKESNCAHTHPVDDLEASGNDKVLTRKDASQSEGASESRSSRLDRMLAATCLLPPTLPNGSSTPLSSVDSIQDMSDFDNSVTMIEPQIIPVSTSIHDELNSSQNQNHHQRKTEIQSNSASPSPTDYFPFWMTAIMPYQSNMPRSDVSRAVGRRAATLWSDVSSEPSDGNAKEFAPDDSWDFNDNEEDVDSDVIMDPFYPAGVNVDDRNLLNDRSQTYRMDQIRSKAILK